MKKLSRFCLGYGRVVGKNVNMMVMKFFKGIGRQGTLGCGGVINRLRSCIRGRGIWCNKKPSSTAYRCYNIGSVGDKNGVRNRIFI